MQITVNVHSIFIKDADSGKEYRVKTVRTAKDIASYLEESENDAATLEVEAAVHDAIHNS